MFNFENSKKSVERLVKETGIHERTIYRMRKGSFNTDYLTTLKVIDYWERQNMTAENIVKNLKKERVNLDEIR